MGKQMVKKEEQSLVKLDLKKYAGRGSENATSTEDLAIPIVQLLQGQSQKVKDGKGDAGQFSNNVTNQIVDSFDAIPCAYWRDYIGWVPRSKGGGFGCRYTVEQIEGGEVKTKWIEYTGEDGKLRRKLMDEQGHEVRDTRNHLVLMRVEERVDAGFDPDGEHTGQKVKALEYADEEHRAARRPRWCV